VGVHDATLWGKMKKDYETLLAELDELRNLATEKQQKLWDLQAKADRLKEEVEKIRKRLFWAKYRVGKAKLSKCGQLKEAGADQNRFVGWLIDLHNRVYCIRHPYPERKRSFIAWHCAYCKPDPVTNYDEFIAKNVELKLKGES